MRDFIKCSHLDKHFLSDTIDISYIPGGETDPEEEKRCSNKFIKSHGYLYMQGNGPNQNVDFIKKFWSKFDYKQVVWKLRSVIYNEKIMWMLEHGNYL